MLVRVLDWRLNVFLSEFKVYSLMLVLVCSRNQYREFRWHFLCYLILLKCIFTWKASYSFPIRASWFLDCGGSRAWTWPAGCRVSQESQIECWGGDAFIISYHPTAMPRCTGGAEVTPLSGPGTETEKCAAMWQEVEKVERRIVEMVEAWRRRAWGGSQREHNPSR